MLGNMKIQILIKLTCYNKEYYYKKTLQFRNN